LKYLILGTAGHIDHGKSALIKALTGTDTDRLKEEKQRGISIDLGFALLPVSDSIMAGVVDVPGHERYLKNMLAGTGAMDVVMLVIAADEGVMPQTREHLAMLDLYGVKHGLVVLTKIDKIDEDWLDLVEEETRSLLAGTFLDDAPVCRVSALTGAGLENLRQTLAVVAKTVSSRDHDAPFRLWIDRVFTVKGHGVVVTGSVLSGTVKTGNVLCVYPGGETVRVRGLEWHGNRVEKVQAGQRAAINLAGTAAGKIMRGMALSAPEGGLVSKEWDILVNWRQEVTSGTRVRLHIGTGEWLGRIYRFKNTDSSYMRLVLEQPLGAAAGDYGILRLYSPQVLVGGAMLIGIHQKNRLISTARCQFAHSLNQRDYSEAVYQALAEHSTLCTRQTIGRLMGYVPESRVAEELTALIVNGKIKQFGNYYITAAALDQLRTRLVNMLQNYHNRQPDRLGWPQQTLCTQLAVDENVFSLLVQYWQAEGIIVAAGAEVALTRHAERHSDWEQQLIEKAEQVFLNIGLVNIDENLVAEKLQQPRDKGKIVLEILVRHNVIIRVGDMYVYRKTIQYITDLTRQFFCKKSTMTVAEFRDMLNTSRKFALPVLEYLDMHKYTIFDGLIRHPGPKIS